MASAVDFHGSASTHRETAVEVVSCNIDSGWWQKYRGMKQVLDKTNPCYLAAKSNL